MAPRLRVTSSVTRLSLGIDALMRYQTNVASLPARDVLAHDRIHGVGGTFRSVLAPVAATSPRRSLPHGIAVDERGTVWIALESGHLAALRP